VFSTDVEGAYRHVNKGPYRHVNKGPYRHVNNWILHAGCPETRNPKFEIRNKYKLLKYKGSKEASNPEAEYLILVSV